MQEFYRPTRIAIIGAGAVGTTTAYTLMLRERAEEIVLIDSRIEKAKGEALDIQHGRPFTSSVEVWSGDYRDCEDADIIIISAGVAQRPGETRQELLARNICILKSVIKDITCYNQSGILLIATNPVDVLSYIAWKQSGWPSNRVIGSGTVLDSARFRYQLGQELSVDPRSVHGYIIGEHGDTELAVWSKTNIAGVPVELPVETKKSIFSKTKDAAYEIIQKKGYTCYAIALALDRICAAILHDEQAVLSVSTLLDGFHGVSDVYMGVPCVVGHGGIHRIIDFPLNGTELEEFKRSAAELSARIQSAASF